MNHKIHIKFDQHTKADEVLDQIVAGRLKQIHDGLAKWSNQEDEELLAACKTLLDWMINPHAQESSD